MSILLECPAIAVLSLGTKIDTVIQETKHFQWCFKQGWDEWKAGCCVLVDIISGSRNWLITNGGAMWILGIIHTYFLKAMVKYNKDTLLILRDKCLERCGCLEPHKVFPPNLLWLCARKYCSNHAKVCGIIGGMLQSLTDHPNCNSVY